MPDLGWSRRRFLRASLLCTATVLCGSPAFGKLLETAHLPEGKLSLHNTHTNERLTVTYRNSLGEYQEGALQALNWILRCHYTNEATQMDLKVIEYLNQVDKTLGGGNEIQIISGYRSPAYNGLLRHEGRGVAKRSYHMRGKAIDIAIPGIQPRTVRNAALDLAAGGVGYYPQIGFVHIDSGNFRTW